MGHHTNIPEGFAFVKRAPGVAAALLDAVDAVGGSRLDDVRTVTGGYLAKVEVAEKYLEGNEGAEVDTETEEPETGEGEAEETDAIETESGTEGDEPIEVVGEAIPEESWKVAEIDDWAKDHDIHFPADVTTKAAKVQHIIDSIPAAETTPAE